MDMGVENRNLYTADVTRTMPVCGRFTPLQRQVYDIVYALAAGRHRRRSSPGVKFEDVHLTCMRVLAEGLHDLGLLPVSVDEAMDKESHGLPPLDAARLRPHARPRRARLLRTPARRRTATARSARATCSPSSRASTSSPRTSWCPAELRGIGVRIEDDVLVTADGCAQPVGRPAAHRRRRGDLARRPARGRPAPARLTRRPPSIRWTDGASWHGGRWSRGAAPAAGRPAVAGAVLHARAGLARVRLHRPGGVRPERRRIQRQPARPALLRPPAVRAELAAAGRRWAVPPRPEHRPVRRPRGHRLRAGRGGPAAVRDRAAPGAHPQRARAHRGLRRHARRRHAHPPAARGRRAGGRRAVRRGGQRARSAARRRRRARPRRAAGRRRRAGAGALRVHRRQRRQHRDRAGRRPAPAGTTAARGVRAGGGPGGVRGAAGPADQHAGRVRRTAGLLQRRRPRGPQAGRPGPAWTSRATGRRWWRCSAPPRSAAPSSSSWPARGGCATRSERCCR